MTSSQYLVYMGSYAAAQEPGIYAFRFDTATGELSAEWSFAGITNPSFLALHPSGRWLYAVSEMSQHQEGKSGEVWSLRLSGVGSAPQPLNHLESGGDWPCHLVIDATGRWLLVSNYGSGTVGVLPILEHGELGTMTDLARHRGSGPNPERQEGPHAHSTILTPDNRFAIVADLGIDSLVIYSFDAANGHLSPHEQVVARPGSGPRHMVFHPNGQHLYVAHELDNTVVVYDYHSESGRLVERQTIETLPPGAPESLVADIHLAPAGNRLYVSNRGDDSLASFAVAADGRMEQRAIGTCGGSWPRNFALAPGNRFVLIANQHSNEITVLDGTETPAVPCSRVAIPGAAFVQSAAQL